MTRVTVRIQWPQALEELPPHSRARVSVEDSTLADESSVVVGETILEDVSTGSEAVAEVEVGDVDAGAELTVRVHVSAPRGASRSLEVGDLVSTQSHPVLTHGYGDTVVVPLRRVGD